MEAVTEQDERKEAKEAIEAAVWDELHRVVKAIRVDGALRVQPELVIRLDRFGGGPVLVIQDEDVAPSVLARLSELAGQNLDVELHEGRLELTSASWAPDRIPF